MSEQKIIAVVSRKGGSGKSTTAIHLAQVLSKKKKDVAVVDFDPEITVHRWAKREVFSFPVYLPEDLRKAPQHEYLIYDTQPNSPKAVGQAARGATHVVVVTGVNMLEADRMQPTFESLAASGYEGPWGVVLSRAPGGKKGEFAQEAIESLDELDIPVLGVVPYHKAFFNAFKYGPSRLKEHEEILANLELI